MVLSFVCEGAAGPGAAMKRMPLPYKPKFRLLYLCGREQVPLTLVRGGPLKTRMDPYGGIIVQSVTTFLVNTEKMTLHNFFEYSYHILKEKENEWFYPQAFVRHRSCRDCAGCDGPQLRRYDEIALLKVPLF